MKSSTLITGLAGGVLAAFTLCGTAGAQQAPALSIDNFIGTVNIVTDGPKITVNGARDGTVTRQGARTEIDGAEAIRPAYCKNTKGNISINIGKKTWRKRIGGYKDLATRRILARLMPT
jgi:hypothetical protein